MERPGMVDWYAPAQLAFTGLRTIVSKTLGIMVDTRRLSGMEGQIEDEAAIHGRQGYQSFDFMADTGDGWCSTYTMAFLLSCPELEVDGEKLPRSEALIMGGDEVYPVASPEAYAKRLVSPFNQALRDVRTKLGLSRLFHTPVFLIPGNHDWYDSLSAFRHRFIERRTKTFGAFEPEQRRSYCVIHLAHDWQIWCVDVQLVTNIDDAQFEFFRRHSESLDERSKVLLCAAEPDRVYGNLSGKPLRFSLLRIRRLVHLRKARLAAIIAGDVHNYQRYEEEREHLGEPYTRHHIVAGGGGAFLHPTHGFPKEPQNLPEKAGEPKTLYPDPATSRRLTRQLPFFAFKHPGMSALCAFFYCLLGWSRDLPTSLEAWLAFPFSNPAAFALGLFCIVGATLFARSAGVREEPKTFEKKKDDTAEEPERIYSRFVNVPCTLWGIGHGVLHMAMAYIIWMWAGSWWPEEFAENYPILEQYLIRIEVFALGMLGAGTLFGLYLLTSLNWLRFHQNETFSAIGSPHYKNFLRCRVKDEKTLEICAIGVERTGAPEKMEHPVPVHIIERFEITA